MLWEFVDVSGYLANFALSITFKIQSINRFVAMAAMTNY